MNQSIVVFDLGKVLVDFDYGIAARRIAARSTRPPEGLHSFLSSSPALTHFETGLISTREFFAQVQAVTGFQGDLAEFAEMFADIFTEITPMVELHADLRRRGLKTYIFSNTNDLAISHIRRNFPFFQNFDGYILSYEVKAIKPHAPIYESLEKMAGKRGEEIIYIDDRAENITAGSARGWQTVLHETPNKTLTELKTFEI